MIEVLSPGLFSTIQDGGRQGYMRYGLSRSGAMDERSLALANILVGNGPAEGAIEAPLIPPALRFGEETLFAVTGARTELTLSSGGVKKTVPMYAAVLANAGDELFCGPVTLGCRAYIAVAGGFAIEKALGSVSADGRARIGGLSGGEKLKRGDVLPTHPLGREAALRRGLSVSAAFGEAALPRSGQAAVLRAVPGPQADALSKRGMETLLSREYTVAADSDRMGIRFEGEQVEFAPEADGNIITDAVVRGAVQLPPSGLPILMTAACQTTGGYAKPLFAATCDLPLAGQLRPGDTVRFSAVTADEARAALLEERACMERARASLSPLCLRVNVGRETYEIAVCEEILC